MILPRYFYAKNNERKITHIYIYVLYIIHTIHIYMPQDTQRVLFTRACRGVTFKLWGGHDSLFAHFVRGAF